MKTDIINGHKFIFDDSTDSTAFEDVVVVIKHCAIGDRTLDSCENWKELYQEKFPKNVEEFRARNFGIVTTSSGKSVPEKKQEVEENGEHRLDETSED